MDASQLARWTRFAAKGGIGKCTAICDCVAQSSEDLMFLKDDEIIVLMHISESDDLYLGSCEDVIGRFRGKDVRFHSKLKRPVKTKRSSVAAEKSPSPNVGQQTPSPSPYNPLNRKDLHRSASLTRSPLLTVTGHTSSLPSTDDESLSPPSMSFSASSTPSEPVAATPPRALDRTPRRSFTSESGRSLDNSPRLPSPPQLSLRNHFVSSPPSSPHVVPPLQIVKKSPTSPPSHQPNFAAAQEQHLNTLPLASSTIPDSPHSTSTDRSADEPESDGEVGIGLSLLQNFAHETDSDDDSIIERASVQHDDSSTVEGLLYDDPVREQHALSNQPSHRPTPRVKVEEDSATSQTSQHAFPRRSPSPTSPTSPSSSTALSPPPHQLQFPNSSPRPSLASSSSWEGASDIYDDYRYSRASMASAYTNRAGRTSMSSRVSASSSKVSATPRDAWDGHIYEQPPPVPDSRPSIDSVMASSAGEISTRSAGDAARRSLDSRKSNETRKSHELRSRKSIESTSRPSDPDSRRSRQELHFPKPPTNVNIQPNLLDHLTRESLRRSSEACRTRSPADFRLSVDSDASIYSRLSNGEQEASDTAKPFSLDQDSARSLLRPAPLDLTQDRSPLLHATWGTPLTSPAESAFGSTSIGSPATSLYMPNALTSLTGGIASALRQKVEIDRKSGEEEKSDSQGVENQVENSGRDIVVADEEDIPSGVFQESTFDTDYSRDTIVDTSKDTIVLPESILAAAKTIVPTATPPMTPSLEIPKMLNEPDPPPSPMVPSQPPITQASESSAVELARPTASTAQPSDLPPPTLADLREGGGAFIPGTSRRQSLFLPHPNAPKAPTTLSAGPMYITSQQPRPQVQVPPIPSLKQSVPEVIHMALHTPRPAMRPRMMSRGPTIYGQTEVDLVSATGPVPIMFSVEPPPPPTSTSRSASPASGLPVGPTTNPTVLNATVPLKNETNSSTSSTGTSTVTGTTNAIPRANFFPKTPGVRPRSRSFSAFNSHSTQIEVPLPLSREEGAKPLTVPTAGDVRQSLNPSSRGIAGSFQLPHPTGLLKPGLKISSLRPSPLSLPQNNSVGSSTLKAGIASKSPTSSLSYPSVPTHPISAPNTVPPSPTISVRPPHQLRHVTSRATLNDAILSNPSVSITVPDDTSLIARSVQKESAMLLRDHFTSALPRDQQLTGYDSDSVSAQGDNRAQPMSLNPTLGRQSSLRTKLSLPNLRRNRSRQDETSSLGSGSQAIDNDLSSTVQVQDLDFELVRPNVQLQGSLDSGTVGREGSLDMPLRETVAQRAASPAGSFSGMKSPIAESSSAWPRPSFSSSITPLARPTMDTESNMDAHRQRESKWMSMMNSVSPSQSRKSKKVKKLLHEGVPSSVRYLVWSHLTDGKAKVVPGVYGQLGSRERIAVASAIEQDIQICFTDQPHLQGKGGPVLALLQAYLTMVPDVRYTTGLTLIAGELLLLAPEEDAFWIFVSIMDAHIRPYFSSSAAQIEVDSILFSRAVESNDSAVAKKMFVDMGISPSTVCGFWFSSLFVSTLPPDYVNRVWDLFLYEGIPFLLRAGLAVIACCRRLILNATSEEQVVAYLRHPSPERLPSTPEAFLALALSAKLKDDDLRKQRLKMEAQLKRQTQIYPPRHPPVAGNISLLRP